MNRNIEKATVYYGSREAGVLEKRAEGFEFIYDREYRAHPLAQPLTPRMPLSQARYESKTLFPLFEDVLPEGWLINLWGKVHQLDESDMFKLLLHMGMDALGPISIQPAA